MYLQELLEHPVVLKNVIISNKNILLIALNKDLHAIVQQKVKIIIANPI